VADGCNIAGTVENSILFPGAKVEEGAEVRNCILFKDTLVSRDARLTCVIADKRVEILPRRTLIGHTTYPLVIAKDSKV
jgi:glucose-1-phosphate adenylyltransferase